MKQQTIVITVFAIIILATMAFIPVDNSIQLDGVITDGEWKDAAEHELTNGGRVMMKKEKHTLYVAITGNKKAWAHVYLSHDDTVRVLHASAALGEAQYVKQNDLWRNIQSFQWQLRERVYNDDLAKKQQDHYRQYGWVANNNNMGNGMTFEFKLDISRTDNDPVPFACVIAEIPLDIYYFPLSLKDNTISARLVQGYTPDSLQFNPGSWEKIR